MSLPNLKLILRKLGPTPGSLKLALAAMTASRPRLARPARALLRLMSHHGDIVLRYRCYSRHYRIFLRLSDLESDYVSARELVIDDVYCLDQCFTPDLVLDGGGNTGLFTLRAAARAPQARIVTCEPLPRNADLIQRHLDANGVTATLQRACIGGTRRSIPFYCRKANQGSFEDTPAYSHIIQVPVITIEDALAAVSSSAPAPPFTGPEKIFIKLDIEGMEIEALEHYVPLEQRAVIIAGELHGHAQHVAQFEQLFRSHGWTIVFLGGDDSASNFRAVSPAAQPLMPR